MSLVVELMSGANTDDDYTVTLERKFKVFTGFLDSRGTAAILLVPVNRGDAHPDYPGAWARSASAEPIDGEHGWYLVTYGYSNKIEDQTGSTSANPASHDNPSPTDRSLVVKIGSVNKKKIVEKDNLGQPLANIYGEKYDPPVEVDDDNSLITISNIYLAYSKDVVQKQIQYKGTVNDANYVLISGQSAYPAGSLKIVDITSVSEKIEGSMYWNVEIVIEYCRNGWLLERLHQGTRETYEVEPGIFAFREIKDSEGEKISTPVLYDEDGGLLAPFADATYRYHAIYPEENYANLFTWS